MLYWYRKGIFPILKNIFKKGIDEKQTLYPAATVLLDLTSNETSIDGIAQLMHTYDMYGFIADKLKDLLKKRTTDS